MGQLHVKSADGLVKGRREAACRRVLEHFQLQLSELSLLCFVDEEAVEDMDFEEKKNAKLGVANRGFFVRSVKSALDVGNPPLPSYVRSSLRGATGENLFHKLIYVHGSACDPEESLIITLSHELQHFFQDRNEPQAGDLDCRLLGRLRNWQEHPSEHDAMLRSKQAAASLCGEDLVNRYADSRIELSKKNQRIWHEDQLRWEFFRSLQISSEYEFGKEVVQLWEKYGP